MDEFRMMCVKLPSVKIKKKISIKFETQKDLPSLEKKQMFKHTFHQKKEEIMNKLSLNNYFTCKNVNDQSLEEILIEPKTLNRLNKLNSEF